MTNGKVDQGDLDYCKIAVRRLRLRDQDEEDVLMETVTRLLEKYRIMPTIARDGSVRPWPLSLVFSIARNVTCDLSRRLSTRAAEGDLEEAPATTPPVDHKLVQAEAADQVHAGLDRIERHHRDVLLNHLAGVSDEESAVRLGVPATRVKMRRSRARAQLRAALSPWVQI